MRILDVLRLISHLMVVSMAAGGDGGAAGMASELAVGFAVAKELMQQGGLAGGTPPPLPGAAPATAAAPAIPDVLDPVTVARMLGVSEADVMAEIESGALAAKKIGSSYRVTRAALDAVLAP